MKGFPEANMHTDRYRHVIPQYDYLFNAEGELLVDFVGKYENLQIDFAVVCSRLGINRSVLPHRNASNDKNSGFKLIIQKFISASPEKKIPYTAYYDDELREYVGLLYAKDISTFEYEFE